MPILYLSLYFMIFDQLPVDLQENFTFSFSDFCHILIQLIADYTMSGHSFPIINDKRFMYFIIQVWNHMGFLSSVNSDQHRISSTYSQSTQPSHFFF